MKKNFCLPWKKIHGERQKIFKIAILQIKKTQMLQKIEQWQAEGFFNPLDFALAHTIATIDATTPDAVLLGSSVASLALSRGNVAWDLSQNPKRLFSEKPQVNENLLAEIAALKSADFKNQNAVFNTQNADSNSPKPLVFDGKRLYLWQYFQAERRIEKDLLKRLNVPKKSLNSNALNALFIDESDQKSACATAFEENFCVISGGPGTGKTTTVTKLLALILQAEPESKIALAAPTGKAAQRLKESIESAIKTLPIGFQFAQNFEPTTIHRLLENRGNGFLYNESRQLPLDVLILDEASMIDLLLMQSVLKALPLTCKLVLLGDDKQLASVDAGCLLNEICTAENPAIQNAIARLKTSYRFNAQSGIGQFASAVLNQKSAKEIGNIFNQFNDLALITTQEEFEKIVSNFYAENHVEKLSSLANSDEYAEQLLNRATKFQVLCALRKGEFGVEGFNKKMEAIFSKKLNVDRGKSEFFEECPVMMTENIAHLGLNNGDLGVCVFNEKRLRFVFKENETLRYFSPERLKNRAEKMFALTVHKSQGSEFQHVVLVLPPKELPILTRELLYTGITRARKKLTIFIPNATHPFDLIYKIIQNPFSRQGGLFSSPCN